MKKALLMMLLITLTPVSLAWSGDIQLAEAQSSTLLYKWQEWDRNPIELATVTETGDDFMGYAPGSVFTCYCPLIIEGNQMEKGYWYTNNKPVKCVWEFYDPSWHRIKITKKPAIIQEGNFNGYKYAVADMVEFVIPAFAKTGTWYVRCYFVGEDGTIFGEGPAVDTEGNSYYILFKVIEGSWIDNIFKAPIYIMGVKTWALWWWLTPIWGFAIFYVICLIITRSAVGFVKVIKGAVEAVREARREWRRRKY